MTMCATAQPSQLVSDTVQTRHPLTAAPDVMELGCRSRYATGRSAKVSSEAVEDSSSWYRLMSASRRGGYKLV